MANFTKNYETTGGTVDGGGVKIEILGGGANPNGMYTKKDTNGNPITKELQTKEQIDKRKKEVNDTIKFPFKSTILTSAIPLGLAYYSYYNKYSLAKGIAVLVIGTPVVIYGTLILYATIGNKKFV